MTLTPAFNLTEYYKFLFKVHYWKCTDEIPHCNISNISNETINYNTTTWRDTGFWLISTIKESAKRFSLFPPPPTPSISKLKPEIIDPCGEPVEWEYEWKIRPLVLSVYILLLFFSIFICVVVYKIVKRCLKHGEKFERNANTSALDKNNELIDDEEHTDDELAAFKPTHTLDHSNVTEDSKSQIEELERVKSQISVTNDRILLQYQVFTKVPNHVNPKPRQVPVLTFLKHTTDYLFSMMDKLLLDNRQSPSRSSPTRSVSDLGFGPTYSTLNSTPRRPLRRSMNRSRGSSPHLPEQDDQSTDPLEKRAWEELIQNIAMNNHVAVDFDVDLNMSISGEPSTRKLLQFFLNQGSIKMEQLQVANLIVNYSLYLVSKEIEANSSVGGIKFENFKLTGSMRKGLKVAHASQFDFHMNFHGKDFFVYEILDQMKSDEIPPGKIILRAKPNNVCTEPKCLKTVQIKQKSHVCLCAKSVSFIAEEMIDRALQNLYTGTRSLIDRLPFRIQRSPLANIVLSIDTRSVIGLGLSEIRVQLIPAIFLPIHGWFQSVPLFATAYSSTQQEYKSKSARGQDPVPVPLGRSDVIWSLDLSSFEQLYLNEVNRKMEGAGIHSCHKTCIKVLKVLFTALSRKSLLDRGELNTNMIETVVYYLLLESTPDQWAFSLISDRISDAYLYLKSALESGRLPNFFINNPHLLKQMPFLRSFHFLLRGKQNNLLSDIRLETVDKKLNFMQDRIRENGLDDCFKDSYSPDTWEFEFFVYS